MLRDSFRKLLLLSSRRPQAIGNYLKASIAAQECLCVSGKAVLWSKQYIYIYIYECTYIYIYIYICLFVMSPQLHTMHGKPEHARTIGFTEVLYGAGGTRRD